MSRDINSLNPMVAAKCLLFIQKCKDNKIDVIITSAYRSPAEQEKLYAVGRTLPGRKVTNVRGGYSLHQYRCAFDFVPIINGKAIWDNIELINKCGLLGESCGLEWSGRWKKFPERLHFQDTGGLTLAQLQAQAKVKVA